MAIIGKANPFFALWAAPDGRGGHESQGDMGSSRQGSLGWAGGTSRPFMDVHFACPFYMCDMSVRLKGIF